MTIYETIKVAISVKQAAEHYGLKVNRNGMACCPFHNDRHPSMKLNEDYFFCFGCGVKGDVIDFVARSFDLSSYEAAQKLAADFGLDPKPPTAAAMVKPKRPYIRQLREDEMLCFRVLTDYLHLLEDWKVRYAPKTPEDALDDRFVEACQMHCYIEYILSRLGTIFPCVSKHARIFRNSRNSPMFLFCFAIASESPKAQGLALRMADYILKNK